MLTGLLVFVLLVVALLAIPVSVTYDVSTRTDRSNDVNVVWAFGLLRIRVPSGDTAPSDAEQDEPSDDREDRLSERGRHVFAAIRQTAFRRRLLRFVGDLWRAIQKDDVRLNVRLGLGDPADTGQFWAFVGPVAGMLTCTEGAAVSIVPDFFDATLEAESRGRIRLVPLHIIYLALALLPPTTTPNTILCR